ncbi:MAG: hypothetical protein QGH60_06755 [Phycisphaerae bacterium]|nr:hypothetical protein [Phycisphaerae bacterium]
MDSVASGGQASSNDPEAQLFENVDMGRVLAARHADAEAQSQTPRLCRACETPLGPSEVTCPACGALIQGRSSPRAGLPTPLAVETEYNYNSQSPMYSPGRTNRRKERKRKRTVIRGDGPSMTAIIVAVVIVCLGALMFLGGPLHGRKAPGPHASPEMAWADFYIRYCVPIIVLLAGLTLWKRAYEPGITFFRGVGVVLGSDILYSGIAMLVTLFCFLGLPKGTHASGLVFGFVVKMVIGYSLLRAGFRPKPSI